MTDALDRLLAGGFTPTGEFVPDVGGRLRLSAPAPRGPGVYVLHLGGSLLYIGKAACGLAQRLRVYCLPGTRHQQKMHRRISAALEAGQRVQILTYQPADIAIGGLPVNGVDGLESGLIEWLCPPWNARGHKGEVEEENSAERAERLRGYAPTLDQINRPAGRRIMAAPNSGSSELRSRLNPNMAEPWLAAA
jgi:hypothetical protein